MYSRRASCPKGEVFCPCIFWQEVPDGNLLYLFRWAMQVRQNDPVCSMTGMTKDEEVEQLRIENSAVWAIAQRNDAVLEHTHEASEDVGEGRTHAIMALASLRSA